LSFQVYTIKTRDPDLFTKSCGSLLYSIMHNMLLLVSLSIKTVLNQWHIKHDKNYDTNKNKAINCW